MAKFKRDLTILNTAIGTISIKATERPWLSFVSECRKCSKKTNIEIVPLLLGPGDLDFWVHLCGCGAMLEVHEPDLRAHLAALKQAQPDLFDRLRKAFPKTPLWKALDR
jgi:hypothetical protein